MNEIASVFPDSRPIVRAREYRWAPWIFAGVAGLGGILLFTSLESSRHGREAVEEHSTAPVGPAQSLPDLVVPPAATESEIASQYYPTAPAPIRLVASPPAARPVIYRTPVSPSPPAPNSYYSPPVVYAPPEGSTGPAAPSSFASPAGADQRALDAPGRIRAQRLAAPSFTIAKGTLIPAVMETAMDSTRPGQVRAIVSRDVHGFDGSRTLVPRGSRLVGEYQAEVAPGQNRATISWTRLIRPDGVTIELRSPASDALGRAGVRGKVNNHTFQRLTDTLLQTAMNIGSGLTQRAVPPVIVVPNGAQPTSVAFNNPSMIQPTLTLAQGARVSVFVANDLDFSDVDSAQ